LPYKVPLRSKSHFPNQILPNELASASSTLKLAKKPFPTHSRKFFNYDQKHKQIAETITQSPKRNASETQIKSSSTITYFPKRLNSMNPNKKAGNKFSNNFTEATFASNKLDPKFQPAELLKHNQYTSYKILKTYSINSRNQRSLEVKTLTVHHQYVVPKGNSQQTSNLFPFTLHNSR
jgi:hypothetical protein